MRTKQVLVVIGLLALSISVAMAGQPVSDAELGLSKTSVFDTAAPEAFQYSSTKPGKSENLPRAWDGIPPQIPHKVDDYLPIQVGGENQCLDCHDEPRRWGKKVPEGKAGPMPQSHYTDLRTPGSKHGKEVRGARYFCNQCHTPQADVTPLVENEF